MGSPRLSELAGHNLAAGPDGHFPGDPDPVQYLGVRIFPPRREYRLPEDIGEFFG